jgi:hypothetical protein
MNHTDRTLRRASLTAGLGLALMAVLAAFGVFGATAPSITEGDATRTAQAILGSSALFRWGVLCLIVVVVLDVVVATALLALFEPVDRGIALLAAWFRVAYAAVYLVAILQLVLALDLLDDPELAMGAIDAYQAIWLVGLTMFGVHLLLVGYLAYRSGYMAKVFGVLLVVAGLGYVVDGFAAVLRSEPTVSVAQFTFVGEVALIGWLLVVGRRKNFHTREPGQPDTAQLDTLHPGPLTSADRRPVGVGEPS